MWIFNCISFLINQRFLISNYKIKSRERRIRAFNLNSIKHSLLYKENNINESLSKYDVFISGSDQVWHPQAVCDAYLLKFVPSNKKKFSYAASIATDKLTMDEKKRYKEAFKSFDAISIRESSSLQLIEDLYKNSVEVVLDPTLLLSATDWDEILEHYPIKDKYLFCYFLSDNKEARSLAEKFAKENNLKIVTLPYLNGKYRKCDKNFGDYKLFDVSPGRLLCLIKNSEYIFTDSFHATVFSLIYSKQPYVFHRSESSSMSIRIHSLLSMFDAQDRFCDTEMKMRIEYILNLKPVDYSVRFEKFEKIKENSLRFLIDNLKRK